MRRHLTLANMMFGTAAILACMLAPVSGIATEPSVNEQLVRAAKKGDLSQVKTLLAQGADVNAKDRGRTVLMWAVDPWDLKRVWPMLTEAARKANLRRSVNLELLKFLVDQGADVNVKDAGGRTCLTYAALHGNLEAVKLFIDKGLDAKAKDEDGRTCLMGAARSGNLELVEFLVDKGVDVNARECLGQTATMGAVKSGNLEVVKFLVDKGADVNVRGDTRDHAVASGRNVFGECLFIRGDTALTLAAESQEVEIMEFLIDKGADMNVKDECGMTVLVRAAHRSRPDVAKVLISKGADLNVRDKKGKTALMYAVNGKGTDREVVRLLVDKGADLNARDKDGMTALKHATESGNLEAVQYLKAHGAE